ncbi:BatA domain-containing protein [Novipirellula sp. SH528]|uniref:BatA domain-containing protein n=1 Tax=Novipirellula sp. SH528 TaxID=3454466 RepID=UPI003F9F6A12
MFLYPALTIGFLFVAVPLLVHLINMLRHRRQKWAAMDFLLASYRKQKKWIRLRQLLLLLARLAVAAVLIAMLCGWNGGGQILGVLGGTTTHHVVVLDDSYSMGDASGGTTAYARALQALQELTRRLATDDGNHQLTVMRSSRASLTLRGGSESGDSAADLSAQTVTSDSRLISRVMSTSASSVLTDLVPALDLATELIQSTPADQKVLYIASDFRDRDWAAPQRLAEAMRAISGDDVSIRMIDCATGNAANLSVVDVSPAQDVWVAGVPVVINAKVRNNGTSDVNNVSLESRVYHYPSEVTQPDPTLVTSGRVETLPALVIESLPAGEEVTVTFQVFIAEQGVHAIEVSLPEDALSIDNKRTCTLPLSDSEKVLVIDADPEARGAYHVASVLDPGSQVRIGAIPDVQPPSFLRSATLETFAAYRAVYLINIPEINENVADALDRYVRRGGGVMWFLGDDIQRDSYNRNLLSDGRRLLPMPLDESKPVAPSDDGTTADVVFGDSPELLAPLKTAGDAALSLIGLSRSWTLETPGIEATDDPNRPRVKTVLKRRDGNAFVTQHDVDRGRVITVLSAIDGQWTNWPGDPTFVVFLLQANADLWSGAAPPTRRFIDEPVERTIALDQYAPQVMYLPATEQPPRVPVEMVAEPIPTDASAETLARVVLDPMEMVIAGEANVSDILQPGISEWAFTQTDGRRKIIPVASVIRSGEGNLKRADPAVIQQNLLPVDVRFLSSEAWNAENQTAGSSTLTLFLLGLLGLLLAAEQALAYWASYHTSSTALGGGKRAASHLGAFSLRGAR